MGYHDAREIPNYWTYAQDFVLQDHMFEPDASWSLPAAPVRGLGMVGLLHRPDRTRRRARTRSQDPNPARWLATGPNDGQLHYAWTDITYLLHKHGVSWGYYVFQGTEPDCENDAVDDLRAGRSRARRRPGSGTRCRRSPTSARTGSWATSSR